MRSATVLTLLLVLALGAGAYNLRRNALADAAEFRPYRGLSTEELDALIEAQKRELGTAKGAWERGGHSRAAGAGGQELMQHVGDFERAQRASDRKRALGSRVAASQADLAGLRRERARRAGEGGGWRHWLRLATRI